MVKLKVLFVVGVVVSMLVICAFAPGICIDRFVLPDGCCVACSSSSSECRNLCMVEEGKDCVCR